MPTKHNILYIETSVVYGGSTRCLLDILNHIDKDKFNPITILFTGGQSFNKLKKTSHEILLFKTPLFYFEIFLNRTLPKRVNQYLLKLKIVSIVLDKIPAIAMLFLFIKKRDIKLVHLNIRPYYYPAIVASYLARIPFISHVRGHGELTFISKFFCRFVKIFIPVSKSVSEELTQQGIPRKKQVIIYDGIEIDQCFNNKIESKDIKNEFSIKENEFVLGYVGRISENKGQQYFIEAAPYIIKEIPNSRFLIIGEVASELQKDILYFHKLKKMVKDLGLENKVIFTGYREDIKSFYFLLHILVLSSLQEGIAGVILEAMNNNIPVVATRSGGPSEIIENNVNGLLVPIKDPSAIANSVIKILKTYALRELLTINAKKILREKFNTKKTVSNIEDVYKSILKYY